VVNCPARLKSTGYAFDPGLSSSLQVQDLSIIAMGIIDNV
jgi:hypothetical protein